jgi:hypothetical protein
MTPAENPFFERPILNSPYDYPRKHWELDDSGQPTQRVSSKLVAIQIFLLWKTKCLFLVGDTRVELVTPAL